MSDLLLDKIINKTGDIAKTHHPVGQIVITPTNTNPTTLYGYEGTWKLIDKDYKYQNITTGCTFSSFATSTSFSAWLHGKTIQLRFSFTNNKALSDTATTIATIKGTSIGLAGHHLTHGFIRCDSLAAIGAASLSWSSSTGTFTAYDWITRATSIPTSTGKACQSTISLEGINPNYMIDSFCDKFYWQRTK